MEQLVVATQDSIPLPKYFEAEVLQNVMVLLVSWNKTESTAILNYLQPLVGYGNIYKFDQGGQQVEVISYYIGKYGVCPAAFRDGCEVHGNANTVSMMADQCFPNLGAIISVGVACGIKEKVQLCDVIVSSKVLNYDKKIDGHGEYLPIGEPIVVSKQLVKLFSAPVQWPNDRIKKRLTDNGRPVPNVKSGVMLSGPYLVNHPAMKEALYENIAHEVFGIEMGGAFLFAENAYTTANMIIVKAVCDFGDGRNNEEYQPTAALLAANLVYNCLSNLKALETLRGIHNVFV